MNVKTFKRMSKRCISTLLSLLMVLSLFTVCMVGTTVTASADDEEWDSVPAGTTITFDATGTNWTGTVYLYIGRKFTYDNNGTTEDVGTQRIPMTKQSESKNVWTYKFSSAWNFYTTFFFSTNSSVSVNFLKDADTYSPTKVYDNITTSTAKTEIVEAKNMKISSTNSFKATGTAPYTVSDNKTYGYVDATLFNYRNATQISSNSDWASGQANQPFDFGVYGDYNTAVADWYKDQISSGATATPLYQGNFRAGSANTGELGTIEYVKYGGFQHNLLYNFYSIANGANRREGADGDTSASTRAIALGLVDTYLNENGNITQNGIELPQFSTAFMETYNAKTVKDITYYNNAVTTGSKTFGTIQTAYSGLKFPFETELSDKGNTVYYYDAATNGNRYYDKTTDTIKIGGSVYGCKNQDGYEGTKGYYPFNPTNPASNDERHNIVNCFGTRFDIEFYMTSDGTLNGEDLNFSFTGDDDVWVYIDGILALDLGGSHNKASGSIDLKDMKYTLTTASYNGVFNSTYQYNSGENTTAMNTATSYNSSSVTASLNDNLIASLQNTDKAHTLTVFYLERGTFDSNFSMSYMLPTTSKLTIEEEIDVTDVNPGLQADTLKVADKDVFNVTLGSDSDSATSNTASLPIANSFIRENSDASGTPTTTLQQIGTGETNEYPYVKNNNNVVSNTAYLWNDQYSSNVGAGLTSTTGGINLLYGQSAVFNDQFADGSNVYIQQSNDISKFTDTYNATTGLPTSTGSGRLVSDYYTTSYIITDSLGDTLGSGNNATTSNTVLQTTGGSNAIPFSSGSSDKTRVTATITNKVKAGSISFTKAIDASDEDNSSKYEGITFKFKVEVASVLGDSSDVFYVPTGLTYKVYDTNDTVATTDDTVVVDDGEILSKNSYISLTLGQRAEITGIPVGTKYRVTETGIVETGVTDTFSVANVVYDENNSAISNPSGVNNGITATVGNVATASNSASYTYNNTTSTVAVLYRFVDRKIVDGKPTDMEDNYTYFVKNVPSDSTENVLKYAPKISNVLSSYTLSESDIKTYATSDSNKTTDITEVFSFESTAEGVTEDMEKLLDDNTSIVVATYVHTPREYTVTFQINGTEKTLTRGFNELVTINDNVVAPKTNDDGAKFMYWAKLVSVDGTNSQLTKVWTPVSTDYYFAYRVTDDADYLAVYEGYTTEDGTPFGNLESPYVEDDGITYHQSGMGYDAVTAERIYDSYSISGENRTRVNVVFGSAGSPDVDENITDVGYILVKNTSGYAVDDEFADSVLQNLATTNYTGTDANSASGKVVTINDANGDNTGDDNYQALMKNYKVDNHIDTGTAGSDYPENKVNLTNKNRLNIVFDLLNDEAHQKNYYTCYTYMVRTGPTEDGTGTTSYIYVSNTPAFFNLKEADPTVEENVVVGNTYTVHTITDSTGSAEGSLRADPKVVADDTEITLKITPAPQYTDEETNVTYVPELDTLTIGKKTYTYDQLIAMGVPTTGGTYTFTFDEQTYIEMQADGTTPKSDILQITAKFKANQVATEKQTLTVNITGEGNGSVDVAYTVNGAETSTTLTSSGTVSVDKDTTATITATANAGYKFVNWTDANNTILSSQPTYEVTLNADTTVNANFAEDTTTTLYFKPSSDWLSASNLNHFAMYFHDGTSPSTWVDAEATEIYGWYKAEVPEGDYLNVIFVAMNSSTNDWNNKIYQTTDNDSSKIAIPTDNKVYFTITGGSGDNYTGTWSTRPTTYSVNIVSGTNGTVKYFDTTQLADATISANSNKTLTVQSSDSITLTPTANSGYQFDKWTVSGATQSGNTFTITGNATITANFKEKTGTTLYLKTGVWNEAGAWFAAYTWNGSQEMWYKLEPVSEGSDIYSFENEKGYSNIIFVRVNPANDFDDISDGNWTGKWNQTGDLTITNGNNMYTMTDWTTGSWGTYSS